ncbi:hypothetical protein MASR2M66_24870 [Chloroflexota bacterium]
MILDLPLILETRRNHALEHATIHLLARKQPGKRMGGHSNPTGFFILGDLTTQEISDSVTEARTRLNSGESELAVHPGCGTNMATTALLAGTFAWFPLRGTKSTLWRLVLVPFALLFALVGYQLSKPLGPWLQKYVTTEADLGDLQIVDIQPVRKGLHRVITK